MIIFGHRGAPGHSAYGENTITSFRRALACGATGLEFDIRRCADGQIVVIHDETIERTTNGRGRVSDFRYEELKRFDAGFGDAIPLLSDVLDEFGAHCVLNIELKDPGLAPDVKKILLERRLESRVIVSAFEWTELQSLTPEVPIALLTSKLENVIEAARRLKATAIHAQKDIVTPTFVAAAREAGLRLHVWTINDAYEISSFRSLGIDGIFTDFPERCLTPAS